jgi:hypothetical protein
MFGDSGAMEFLKSAMIQLTTDGFGFAASSPLAPHAPFRSYWGENINSD